MVNSAALPRGSPVLKFPRFGCILYARVGRHHGRDMDLTDRASHLIDIVRKAGSLAMERLANPGPLSYKTDDKYATYPQLVSAVDLVVQSFLVEQIQQHYPYDNIISEERPSEFNPCACNWIIDPVDGTAHFARGLPLFSISIALYFEGAPQVGAVYAPYTQDLYYAVRHDGAFHNGKRIRVSTIGDIDQALVAISVHRSFKIRNKLAAFERIVERIRNIRMFAASALDTCFVAAGHLDARIFANTELWDHAAAALVVEEAGGLVTDWSGRKWQIDSDQLLVSNGILHELLLNIVNGTC